MNSELHNQIYGNINLKETEELLDIWQMNNRAEWTDEVMEIVKAILLERGVEIPDQVEPVYEIRGEEEIDDWLFENSHGDGIHNPKSISIHHDS